MLIRKQGNKFGCVVNKQGYYSGYSDTSDIEFPDGYNEKNQPSKYYRLIDSSWFYDFDLERVELKTARVRELNTLLDKNKQKLMENKVIYTEEDPNFTLYEEKYRKERSSLLSELMS